MMLAYWLHLLCAAWRTHLRERCAPILAQKNSRWKRKTPLQRARQHNWKRLDTNNYGGWLGTTELSFNVWKFAQWQHESAIPNARRQDVLAPC